MNKVLSIFSLLFMGIFLFSCAGSNYSNESTKLRSQLSESLIKWKSFKKKHHASYQFLTIASGNTPPNKTVITVENDRIVRRANYQSFDMRKLDDSLIWLEDSPETLGKNNEPLMKIDDYYVKCDEILDFAERQSAKNSNSAGISFDKNGLIAGCGDGAEAYDDGSHTFHLLDIVPSN